MFGLTNLFNSEVREKNKKIKELKKKVKKAKRDFDNAYCCMVDAELDHSSVEEVEELRQIYIEKGKAYMNVKKELSKALKPIKRVK